MLPTLLIILLVLLLFFFAFLLLRTLRFARPMAPVDVVDLPDVDAALVAQHLSQVIRCPTHVVDQQLNPNRKALFKLADLLEKLYPRVHAMLKRETIHDYSLLYTWEGSQPDQPGVLFLAHLDVIPADPATLTDWVHPPFEGQIADGYVWGRGTLDDKNQVIGLLEAVEYLLRNGWWPQRTVYLAFGHDEELGGSQGAARVSALLAERGAQIEAVLDEGTGLVDHLLPGVEGPVAPVGLAEKGYLTLELSVEAAAGHSSMPDGPTAIERLSRALVRLQAHPMPAQADLLLPFFRGLGAALPFRFQLVFANFWLFKGLIRRTLLARPQTAAAIRTTSAATVIQGGGRENVLPSRASARVNFRLLPGDTIAAVCEHVRRVIADPCVHFEPAPGSTIDEASPSSSQESDAFQRLSIAVRQVFGMEVPVVPYLVLGMTDSRHYLPLCNQVYRFAPIRLSIEDLERVHGVNERIAVQNCAQMVQFNILLIESWSHAEEVTL